MNTRYRPPNTQGTHTHIGSKQQKENVGTKSTQSQLIQHIIEEIKDRRAYQTTMEELGKGTASREQIAREIALRLKELKQLDPNISIGDI